MFYLEKCAAKDCDRSGSVALESSDVVCNIHKDRQVKTEVTLKNKEEEEEEE